MLRDPKNNSENFYQPLFRCDVTKVLCSFFWKLLVGEWWPGMMKKNADNADAPNGGGFARRICSSSLALPSERTGGVAIASATANAREAPTHPLSCISFASIFSCVCDSNEQTPGSGRARAALRKCDERSSGAKRRICVICVLFSHSAHPSLTHLQCPEKRGC